MAEYFEKAAEQPTTFANRLFGSLGSWLLAGVAYVGGSTLLLLQSFYWAFIRPFSGRRIKHAQLVKQMVRVGFNAIPIVFLVIFFVGMIIAFQMAYVLRRFNVVEYAASVVSIAMVRELGPMLTGVVMAGFAGASIAAELGTMRVNEEISALESIGLNPVGYLVVPRLLATMIMVPCLTILADLVGIMGGFVIGTGLLGINYTLWFNRSIEFLVYKDIYTGTIKSLFFAIIVALISCYEGFRVEGGPEGVGRATTRSVVIIIVMVIAADCFFTALFYFILD